MTDAKFSSVFGPPVNIAYILNNPPPPIDFVLPGLTAGSVGTLIGPGGMGKTMFELQVAVLLATGLGHYDPLFGPSTFDGLPWPHKKSFWWLLKSTLTCCGTVCMPSCGPWNNAMCCQRT